MRKRIRKSKVYIDKEGYKRFKASGKLVDRHVMEKKLGIRLSKYVIVHHINGIKTDNRFENLQLITKKEYSRHYVARKDSAKTSILVGMVGISIWILRLIIERIVSIIINVFKGIKGWGKSK